MWYLSYITEWVLSFGPVVVGGITIGSGLVIFLVFRASQFLVAKRRYIEFERMLAERIAAVQPDVNPAEKHFKSQRIDLAALANPMTGQIVGKKFDDCEIFGPAMVVLWDCTVFGASFENTNLIAIRPDRPFWTRSTIQLINCQIRGGLLSHLNIIGYPDALAPFLTEPGAFLASFSGDDELDAIEPPTPKGAQRPPPPNPGSEEETPR